MGERIHIVSGGGVILAVYHDLCESMAGRHARTISGASVTSYPVLTTLPTEVRDDLEWAAEWHDEDEDTPVIEICYDDDTG